MGSGRKSSDNGALIAMQQQMRQQQESFNKQLSEQKQQTERMTAQTLQATNASQKANAISTNHEDLGIRSQGQLAQQGSANETIKGKLGGSAIHDNEKKEAWY